MTELKLNKYIRVLMNFYENVVVSPEDPIIEIEKTTFLSKPKRIETYPERDKILEEINNLRISTIIPTGMSFNDLWEFCQFVKYAEKALFYQNDPIRLFYVDSDIDDLSKRQFAIKDLDNSYQLLFKLEKTNEPIHNEIMKIIRLSVSRNYGRKMTNEFIIVNSEIKYNDDADIYLIDNINRILYERITNTFNEIINLVRKR